MFLGTVKKVKLEVRPLFLPQLVRLTAMLRPGLRTINVSFIFGIYYQLPFTIFILKISVDRSKMVRFL